MKNPAMGNRSDDTPFDFNLDSVRAEVEHTPFVFVFAGQRWIFEHMKELDVWELIADADAGDVAAGVRVIETAMGKKEFAEFRKHKLTQFKLEKLFDAYQQHCGVEPGE